MNYLRPVFTAVTLAFALTACDSAREERRDPVLEKNPEVSDIVENKEVADQFQRPDFGSGNPPAEAAPDKPGASR